MIGVLTRGEDQVGPRHIQEKDHVKAQRDEGLLQASYKPKRESLKTLLTCSSWASSLQNREKINFRCLNFSVCSHLWWQPVVMVLARSALGSYQACIYLQQASHTFLQLPLGPLFWLDQLSWFLMTQDNFLKPIGNFEGQDLLLIGLEE